jgi:hypothetical protein
MIKLPLHFKIGEQERVSCPHNTSTRKRLKAWPVARFDWRASERKTTKIVNQICVCGFCCSKNLQEIRKICASLNNRKFKASNAVDGSY